MNGSFVVDCPPIRMSVDDCNFDGDIAARTEILLDGVPQQYVTAYDVFDGWIERVVTDENGKVQLNEARDEILRERVISDKITVRWKQ